MRRTIRFQISLILILTTLLTLIIVGGVLLFLASQYSEQLGQSYMETAASDLNSALVDRAQGRELPPEEIQLLIREQKFVPGVSVRVFDEAGNLLFDRALPPISRSSRIPQVILEGMEGRRTSPFRILQEARQARMAHGGLPSMMNGFEFQFDSGSRGYTIQLVAAEPLLNQLVQAAATGFSIAAALALLVAGIAGLLAARFLSRPILALSGTIASLGPEQLAADPSVLRPPSESASVSREVHNLHSGLHELASRLGTAFSDLKRERDSLKSFLGDASHEVRTPLMAAETFLDLLDAESPSTPAAKELSADLRRQLSRIRATVTGLLHLTRIESGVLQLNLEPIRLSELLPSLVRDCQAAFPDLDAKVTVEVEENLRILADVQAVRSVFQAVLENSFLYGANEGTVHIQIFGREEEQEVRVWLQDSGPGMSAEELDRVGERFFRGTAGLNSRRGLGIGLAAARQAMQQMGAAMEFSNPGGLRVDCLFPKAAL